LTQACSIAGIALDVTGTSIWDFLTHILKFFNVFRELVADSFMQAIVTEEFKTQSFFNFTLDGIFRLPHWFYSAGYSFTCIIS